MLESAALMFAVVFAGTLLTHAIYKSLLMTYITSAAFLFIAFAFSLFAILRSEFASLVIPACGIAGMGLCLAVVFARERRKKPRP